MGKGALYDQQPVTAFKDVEIGVCLFEQVPSSVHQVIPNNRVVDLRVSDLLPQNQS